MKKLLTATTALALVGGVATAELSITGDAKLGLNYDSKPGENNSKHSFTHEMGVDFTVSGTTDGGLAFGAKSGFDTGDEDTNEGKVWVSGSFGTITIGNNDSADLLAGGIADVGLNGAGVDDVVEGIRGTTEDELRYDNTVGNIALALSAGTGESEEATLTEWAKKKNDFAVGMSFSASGATIGLGYDSRKTVSAGIGYSTGQISASAFYAKRTESLKHYGANAVPQVAGAAAETGNDVDGMYDSSAVGIGMDISYTMGASKITLAYAKTDISNVRRLWDTDLDDDGAGTEAGWRSQSASNKAIGVGFSHDLGGGATLVAGFAQVPMYKDLRGNPDHIGQVTGGDDAAANEATFENRQNPEHDDYSDLNAKKNVASIGLSFTF